MLGSDLLNRLQDAPRFNRHGLIRNINATNAVHALEAKDDFMPAGVGGCATAKASIATLRDNRYLDSIAILDDRSDFLGSGRHHHSDGLTGKSLAPIGQEGCGIAVLR